MHRIIRTRHLISDGTEIWYHDSNIAAKFGSNDLRVGPVRGMPKRIPMGIIKEWDEICERHFQEFINATE